MGILNTKPSLLIVLHKYNGSLPSEDLYKRNYELAKRIIDSDELPKNINHYEIIINLIYSIDYYNDPVLFYIL